MAKQQAPFPNPPRLPINTDTLLILEKTFEGNQQAIENLNILEQLLVGIVENINQNHAALVSNYILRRLPTYTVPYLNKNEYGIILDNIPFTLSSPRSSVSDSVSVDGKPIKISLGQIEVFKSEGDPRTPDLEEILNSENAFCSHEIFKRFSSAFLKAFSTELEKDPAQSQAEGAEKGTKEKVQILGPHLLHQLRHYPEVDQIFSLTMPSISLSPKKKGLCIVQVDHLKSVLTLQLDGTEVTVRPCLFIEKGYPKLNHILLERVPIYHPAMLSIATSLSKGCLLFPTSFETLWTIQFWPAESHILSTFHPSSIMSRVFRLYGSFVVSPVTFWETLQSCFLIGLDDLETLSAAPNRFPFDFLLSTFLAELETLPAIEDWSPKNFSARLTGLLHSAVEAWEKGFHSHYFTRTNVLRSLWKTSAENIELEEKYALRELDDIEEFERSPSPAGIYKERKNSVDFQETRYDLEDEFGLHFEDLSLDDEDDLEPKRYKSVSEANAESREALTKGPRSISKFLGSTLRRRFSMLSGKEEPTTSKDQRPKSMIDIASGFEHLVNQQRREQTLQLTSTNDDDVFASTLAFAETSFTEPAEEAPLRSGQAFDNQGFSAKESIYTSILQVLDEVTPSIHDTELITHLDTSRRVLTSQAELIAAWSGVIGEIPRPKHVCPHTFSPRQIQYISLVIQVLSKCTQSTSKGSKGRSRMPAWEISGDLLRTVLYQMRAEATGRDSDQEQRKARPVLSRIKKMSFKSSRSFSEGSRPKRTHSKFSFRRGSYDVCKGHTGAEVDPETETQLALEDPETSATHRLLQWLWQLRNSEIGRLSRRAESYIASLHSTSLVNSHFLEQFTEQKVLESMGVRSAVAVSRIMRDQKFPAHVPLVAAAKRGWLWAEMVLSLVSWNRDKGYSMKAEVPFRDSENMEACLVREILHSSMGPETIRLSKIKNAAEPDTEAVALAFHSELATPLGWNDFEDPRRPGPFTVGILIFSSLNYFSQWEMVPGNIVQVLVRLQKFSVLQHIGTMLLPPHRKTALNEVRKLNKSLSFHTFAFDENVMTKTFRRLASLRHTRRFLSSIGTQRDLNNYAYTCQQVGCLNNTEPDDTTSNVYRGIDVECTRM